MTAQQVPVQVSNFEEENCGVKCGMKKSQPIAMFSITEQSQATFGELCSLLAKLHRSSLSWINKVFLNHFVQALKSRKKLQLPWCILIFQELQEHVRFINLPDCHIMLAAIFFECYERRWCVCVSFM